MSKINVLPMQVANLIAAGEVVDRPASVVKELLENAMDAGATSVSVEVAGGGVGLVRVTDNGSGMDEADAVACFGRHATSKIRSAEDLAAIATLGFRGEALAAVAAVSRVTLRTRRPESDEGTEVVVEGGLQISVQPCGCPVGTSIAVRDLFYNTPARKKFLKKESTETATIGGLVEKLALSRPDLAVSYVKDGRQTLRTDGTGGLQAALQAVYGQGVARHMLPVDVKTAGLRVHGMVCLPEAARPNRLLQTFFVAGRTVRSRVLQIALEEAYKGMLTVGRYPSCVLFVELHPAQVDANVHPQKMEVKFANEQAVFDALKAAVRQALTNDAPPLLTRFLTQQEEAPAAAPKPIVVQAPPDGAMHAPGLVLQTARRQKATIEAGDWQFHGDLAVGLRREREEHGTPSLQENGRAAPPRQQEAERPAPPPPHEAAAERKQPQTADLPPPSDRQERVESAEDLSLPMQSFRLAGELYRTYLVAEFESEIWLIDKHAARERMLYEQLVASDAVEVQQLLAPQVVECGRVMAGMAVRFEEQLNAAGFDVQPFGDAAVLLRTLPMGVDYERGGLLLQELCQLLEEGGGRPGWREELLHRVACIAAVKAGEHEPPEAGEQLVKALLTLPDIRHCPHGRPCIKRLPRRDLEKEFHRL